MNQSLNQLGMIPPQAIELEEAVLGSILIESDAIDRIIDILSSDCFYKESNRAIFNSILTLYSKSEPIDMLTVTSQLRKDGKLELAGGAFYVTELTSKVSSSAHIEAHSKIIYEQFIKRELIRINSESQKLAFLPEKDAFELLAETENRISSITETINTGNVFSGLSLVPESLKRIELSSKKDKGITGIPSLINELDKIIGGWQNSDLVIIAARPAMGKTDLAINLALNAARLGYKTAFFSLEMSKEQLMDRALSVVCEIDRGKVKTGKLESDEWIKITNPDKKTMESFFIADEPTLSTYGLRAKCRQLKRKQGIQLIIIDYLQLMQSEVHGSTNDKISHISRTLKLIAKELNIPLIALSQLSRSVETRGGDKRPMLSDLRDSGAIEQDADIVLFPYRPIYYGINERQDGSSTNQLMEIDIAKHRSGAVGSVDAKYLGKYGKVTDYTDETINQQPKAYRTDQFRNTGVDDFEMGLGTDFSPF